MNSMAKQEKKYVSTIPLSLRGKKRYILFQLSVEGMSSIPKHEVQKTLHHHLLRCYGSLGLPLHRYKFIGFDTKLGKGIVRCAHTSRDAIISALLTFTDFQGKKASLKTISTSGTLKTLRPYFE